MDDIFEKLYSVALEPERLSLLVEDKELLSNENSLHCRFISVLSKEQETLFFNYINTKALRHQEELKIAYEEGFKTATKLILHALKG